VVEPINGREAMKQPREVGAALPVLLIHVSWPSRDEGISA
jgi:hypothetical protein